MKLCKDCKHYCQAARCDYHKKTHVNLILGGSTPVYDDCVKMREGTAYRWRWSNCGHNGMHWKSKEEKANED